MASGFDPIEDPIAQFAPVVLSHLDGTRIWSIRHSFSMLAGHRAPLILIEDSQADPR